MKVRFALASRASIHPKKRGEMGVDVLQIKKVRIKLLDNQGRSESVMVGGSTHRFC